MTLKQISEALNSSIVPAIMGEDYEVNPNLDNIVDLGTRIQDMTADQFKSYFGEFAAAVRTYADTREYYPEDLPLYADSEEYGGIVQSIKTDFTEVRDSAIYSLIDGTTYNDVNKFFGTTFDNRVYEKDTTWNITRSVPQTMWKKAFLNAQGVTELVALIEVSTRNTVRRNASALVHNLISSLAIHGRAINLVTMYNNFVDGLTDGSAQSVTTGTWGAEEITLNNDGMIKVTAENAPYNKYFMTWALEIIKNVGKAAKFANKKYNDGTISTWISDTDTILLYNSAFRNRAEAFDLSQPENMRVYDTPFWNAQPDSLIPTVANSSHVVYNDTIITAETPESSAENNKDVQNVVAIVYDRWAVGYTTTPIPTRTSYNAQGDFINTFIDTNCRYWLDTRNTAIVFTLN